MLQTFIFQSNLTELKSFGSPPETVVSVCAAVLVLLSNPTQADRDRGVVDPKVPKDRSWKAAKVRGNLSAESLF